MDILDSKELIDQIIKNNEMVLVYFGTKACGVCNDIKPKIEKILKDYPNINKIYVDVEKSHKVAVDYNIFTIPGIILFVEGKETIREARQISIGDIKNRIDRYYNLLFN